jgi:hypothetical protein
MPFPEPDRPVYGSTPPVASADAVPTASSPSKTRLIYVDAIRGLLLVFMAVDHIPSDLQVITNHPLGYVSAAEGFVFMSGLMSGWVYSKRYYREGVSALKEASMRRALAVYLYHLVTFITVLAGVCLLAYGFGIFPNAVSDLMIEHPWATFLSGCVFLQQPSLFDILPMYCVFLVVLPLLLIACARGQRRAVLLASFLIWLLTNLFSPQAPLVNGMINTGSFNLLAWQLLFVVGAVFGQAWTANESIVPKIRGFRLMGVGVLAAFLFCVRHAYIHVPLPAGWLNWLTNKNNVAPLRLFDALLIYYLVYALVSRFPKLLAWRPMAFLGRHSIFVFALHIVVAYAILSFPDVFGVTSAKRWFGTALMIASLFAAAGIHEWFGNRQRARQNNARQVGVANRTIGYESGPLG